MMPFVPPVFAAGIGVVTVSGETVIDIVSGPGLKVAGVIFHANGTISKVVGTTISQIDGTTDWIRPTDYADSLYEVRYTGRTGDLMDTEAAAEDTWIALSADRRWDVSESGGGITSNNSTFEIRRDGGAVLDSGSYTLTADDT